VALVFERLDTVVEHLRQSPELEAQRLQLGRVQLVRLLAVGVVQPPRYGEDRVSFRKEGDQLVVVQHHRAAQVSPGGLARLVHEDMAARDVVDVDVSHPSVTAEPGSVT